MSELLLSVGRKVVTVPALEPVTVAQARKFCKRADTSEDVVFGGMIGAARLQVEADAGVRLTTQDIELAFDSLPCAGAPLELDEAPLQSVVSLTTYSASDVESVDAVLGNYVIDLRGRRLILKAGQAWPAGLRAHLAAVVKVRAGFSAPAIALASLTRSGTTATATAAAAHGLTTGAVVTIAGANEADYNGSFDVTVLSATVFTFQVSGTPASPATGTITATPTGVPQWAQLAILLRVAAFNEHREMFDGEQRLYDRLVASGARVRLV